MKNHTGQVAWILKELIQANRDSYTGYLEAAREVEDKELKELLRKEASQRNQYFVDLKREAFTRGIPIENNKSFLGQAHRAWMHFRHNINPHRDLVPLLECKRGEQHALAVYEDVFENHLLPELYPNLERQFVSIIEMRDRLNEKVSQEGTNKHTVLRLL